MTGCASVEVVREATKDSKIIETSVKKIFESPVEHDVNKKKEQKTVITEQEISKKDGYYIGIKDSF